MAYEPNSPDPPKDANVIPLNFADVLGQHPSEQGAVLPPNFDEFLSQVDDLPEFEPIVHNLFACGDYGMLVSRKGSGKTWALSDLAVSVASGTDWMRCFPTKKHPVLFIANEGGKRKIARRLSSVAVSNQIVDSSLDQLFIETQTPTLNDPRDLMRLDSIVRDLEIKLILIDSVYLSLAGVSLNNQVEVGTYLGPFKGLLEDNNCTSVFSHHPIKPAGRIKGPVKLDDVPRLDPYDSQGAGLAEWSRFLILVTPVAVKVSPDEKEQYQSISRTHLIINLISDEESMQEVILTRTIAAPFGTLKSEPMAYLMAPYESEVMEFPILGSKMPKAPKIDLSLKAAQKVLALLSAEPKWYRVIDIRKILKMNGLSISKYLTELGPEVVFNHDTKEPKWRSAIWSSKEMK